MHLLIGLDTLFTKFGLFNINVFLLGVSSNGIGKAWINENFANNFVNPESIINQFGPHE